MDRKGGNFLKDIIYGRPRPTPKLKKYLNKNGNVKIEKLCVYRAPLSKTYILIADYITQGKFSEIKKLLNYDDIYHLALYFELQNGCCGLLEKNHVIQINKLKKDIPHYYLPVELNNTVTLNLLLEKA